MEERKRNFVLLDFDGVIADSYAVAFETARTLCAHITEEEYARVFEGNVHRAHDMLMGRPHGPECHHDLDWFEMFVPAFEDRALLFPGMRETIEVLFKEYILIIVSSTITSPIRSFLERNHIGRYFSEVMGADVHTSKVEKMRMIFDTYKTIADRCVFITDTLGDMREAQEHEMGAIGCSWGFHTHETLEKGIPFRIVDHPRELPDAVRDYFAHA